MPSTLLELVAGVLNIPPEGVTMGSGPKNVPRWDSLAHVTIIAAVEQAYGVALTMPEILSIRSVANLQDALERRGVAVAGGGRSG